MPKKFKDQTGKEFEAYMPDEVENIKEEAKEEAKKEIESEVKSEYQEKVESYQEKIDKKNQKIQELEEEGGNEEQVNRLREERDEKESELQEVKNELSQEISSLREEVHGNTKSEMIENIAGDDAELRERIEHEFENYRPNDTSREAIKERVQKAAKLAGADQTENPDVLDNTTGGSGKADTTTMNDNTDDDDVVTENTKEQGKVLGVDEEDYEKYEDEIKEQTNS